MIREGTIEDVAGCEKLAEEYYAKRNTRGAFSGQHFVEFWGKIMDGSLGRIFVRESGEDIVEAIGLVIHPNPFSGELAASSMFWYIIDEPQGFAIGYLFKFVSEQLRKIGVKETRFAVLADSRLDRIGSFLNAGGFAVHEITYMREDK